MYCNHVAADGSWGATVHTTLLMPGAHGRAPLSGRFSGLDRLRGPSWVAFIYGDANDWMDRSAAEAVRDGVRGMEGRVAVCSVAGAGHNVPRHAEAPSWQCHSSPHRPPGADSLGSWLCCPLGSNG